MQHQTTSYLPSLKTLCERIIFTHRDWLGDIGNVPVLLLEDCLHACSAQQLARIEDETSEGGVNVSVELAHHWKRCFEERFGSFDNSKREAPVLASTPQLASSTGAGTVLDWRALYQWREQQYEAKLRASGERLRQRTAAESSGRDSRSIQVLSAVARRPPAQKGFLHGSGPPSQVPSSRCRLLRKLGMGSSKQSPSAKAFRVIKRAPGAASTAGREGRSAGSAFQLVESELDLATSSTPCMPQSLGSTYHHETPSKASSASSGSQALQMTDNCFVSQPAFEERLQSAPDRCLHKPPGQLRASSGQAPAKPAQATGRVAKQGRKHAGHLESSSRLVKTTARAVEVSAVLPRKVVYRSPSSKLQGAMAIDSTASQQSTISSQPAPARPVKSQQAQVPSSSTVHTQGLKPSCASRMALSAGRMQVSPQPKLLAKGKLKAQPPGQNSTAEQPAKRIKYDHLLGGSALLSLAGKQSKKS